MAQRKQDRIRRRGKGRCKISATIDTDTEKSVPGLPETVIAAMDEALADERKALATYRTVMRRFGRVQPFANIARSEERHIDALHGLYTAYGIVVPNEPVTLGPAVERADMTALCEMCVEGEIENVRLYDDELLPAVIDYPDIMAVLTNLRNASALNHRPAFERCVKRHAAR